MDAVRIRGHHLICLHFFHGAGYSAEFVMNLVRVMEHLRDAPLEIVDGFDDVCASCPSLRDGVCHLEPEGETGIRRLDALALELLEVAPGMVLRFAEIRDLLPFVLDRWRALACEECGWECEECGWEDGAPVIDIVAGLSASGDRHRDNPGVLEPPIDD